mmetsp:Transcript_32160/g.85782  ORF Transcript_32160/g.85782 Transcript_32160/m.85782 type:complete len:236 (+) Transcript_32160:189-896(+)
MSSMASGRAVSTVHWTVSSHVRASSARCPKVWATSAALASPPALNSAVTGRSASSRSRTASLCWARKGRRTATTKHGQGVGISPTRRNSPWSTKGLVMNFSHRNPLARAGASGFSRRASRAPSRLLTISKRRFSLFHPCCSARSTAIRCEPEPILLMAQILLSKSSTFSMLCPANKLNCLIKILSINYLIQSKSPKPRDSERRQQLTGYRHRKKCPSQCLRSTGRPHPVNLRLGP